MKITTKGKFEIKGRGTVYTLDLEENGLPLYRKDFYDSLMNKEVEIDDKKFIVKGIEAFATFEGFVHKNIGILVKETGM